MVSLTQIRKMMEQFVRGEDRSTRLASEIEGALDELFGEEEPFAAVTLALASYQPGGGAYLYGEAEMVRMVAEALQALPQDGGSTAPSKSPGMES